MKAFEPPVAEAENDGRSMESTQTDTGCAACGGPAAHVRIHSGLDRCIGCGFVVYREVAAAELNQLYDESYFAGEEYADYLGEQDALRRSMRRHLAQMRRYRPLGGSLLEVGCAYGLFLDEARSHFRAVAGVDISAGAVRYASERLGLDAREGDFLAMDFAVDGFDVVCMWDTIEHLPSPDRFVARAAELLRSGGHLYLTTGDIGSLNARLRGSRWRQIHPPTHLNYFSRATITRLLERLGFEVLGIETASYYHTLYNVLAALRLRGGSGGRAAAIGLSVLGERVTRRTGLWINLGDTMFVAARRVPRTG
jgi:SAM-dependent methyltransferase